MRLATSTVRLLLSAKVRTRIYESLAVHIENDLNVLTTLRLLRKRVPKGVWVQESFLDIAIERMAAGETLANAFKGCIPDLEYMLLVAGDRTGSQAETLRRVAGMIKIQAAVMETVRKSLGYPLFLLLLFAGLLITVALFVVPAFLTVVELHRWQGFALILHDMSTFVASWRGVVMGLVLLLLALLIYLSLPRWTGATRRMVEHVPPWSLYRLQVSSMWLFTVATMLRNGIRMADALEISRNDSSSPWLRQHLDILQRHFAQGKDIAQALLHTDRTFLENDLKEELTVYASLPGFAEKLPTLAEQWLHMRVEDVSRGCRRLNVLGIIAIFCLLLLVGLATMDFVTMLSAGTNIL